MKSVLLILASVLTISSIATPAYACSITPLEDTRLRLEAILQALDQMVTLQELKNSSWDVYDVITFNHSTQIKEHRSYLLVNSSAMCPIYEAREIN